MVKRVGQLDTELNWLRGIPLLVCDEVGYIHFVPDVAAEVLRLGLPTATNASLIVSLNNLFSAWTEISMTLSASVRATGSTDGDRR